MRCNCLHIVLTIILMQVGTFAYAQETGVHLPQGATGHTFVHALEEVPLPAAVVFLDEECPVSQKYSRILQDLHSQYEGRISFVAIFMPDLQGNTGATEYLDTYGFRGIILNDSTFTACDHLGAKITPEAFLIDSDREVRYQGAIDNWYYALGKYRRVTTEYYLKDAMDQLLSGEEITISETQPIGCYINQKVRVEK